jgi:Undecaprenyl-phosphate glucose phosphotransferase
MSSRPVNRETLQRLLKCLDAGVLFGTFAVLGLSPATHMVLDNVASTSLLMVGAISSLGAVLVLRTLGLYEPLRWLKWWPTVEWSVSAVVLAAAFAFTLTHLIGLSLTMGFTIVWASVAITYFTISRYIISLWAQTIAGKGGFHQRVAIVGGGQAAEDTLKLLTRSHLPQIEIVGLFDDRYDTRSPDSVEKYQKLGKITELADYARSNRIDLIIVAIPMSAEKRLLHILKRLWELPVNIRISAASAELKLSPKAYSYLGDLPLFSVFERRLDGWSAFMKDVLDRVLAATAIVAFAPLMLAVAAAIKWESKGPVIFRQKRYGFNNELIEVYKFRSMFTDRSDATAVKLVTKDDPRVTKVGRIIRKTSIDELPQLFNVVKGGLSLVGPRPHALQAKAAGTLYDEVVDGYFARHKVKPGITGWAQINGWRGETDTREKLEQRVKHDLEYIDKWSLLFDIYILAKTPVSLLKTENAY